MKTTLVVAAYVIGGVFLAAVGEYICGRIILPAVGLHAPDFWTWFWFSLWATVAAGAGVFGKALLEEVAE